MVRMMTAPEEKSDSITITSALAMEDSMTVPADTALAEESSPHHEKVIYGAIGWERYIPLPSI